MSDALTCPLRDHATRTATLTSPGGLEVRLTPAGDLSAIGAPGGHVVNQYAVGPHDAALSGLYLRRTTQDGTEYVALTGSRSSATYQVTDGYVRWDGDGLGVTWTVHLALDPVRAAMVWRVEVQGSVEGDWDLAATQDLSLAPAQVALASESYVSQYVAHRLEQVDQLGTVVLSRQTMAAAPVLPLFAFAIAEGASSAGTDAFDLHTSRARAGHTPAFLTGEDWPNRVRQHEMAMAGLLSHPVTLNGAAVFHVVGTYWSDLRGDMTQVLPEVAETVTRVVTLVDEIASSSAPTTDATDERSLLATAALIGGASLADEELLALADDPHYVERGDDGEVLSYFAQGGVHVVRGEKDLDLIRPHGHVMMAGDALSPEKATLSTTVFAHGIVGSHTVLGNTSFDRFVSVHRNHLNLLHANGVRVLARVGGEWGMLAQPSAFILDIGEARWIYRLDGVEITIRTVADASRDAILTEVTASTPTDIVITSDIDLADGAWRASVVDGGVVFQADDGTSTAEHHDALAYVLAASANATITGDAPLFGDGRERGTTLVTTVAESATEVRLVVAADLDNARTAAPLAREIVAAGLSGTAQAAAHRALLGELTRNLRIEGNTRLAELEVLLPWWANDARVHYLVPHGLEQYSGAAWGTRDVLQGPFELLLAAGRYDACRDIILRVLKAQSTDGTFPQWFMFDDYAEVFQDHSHGDIVHWPVLALGEYLRACRDLTILDAAVPFRDGGDATTTVADHLDALVAHLETDRVPGTALPAYGDGDWDDTLQPARAEMRVGMASTWTTALAHQAQNLLADELDGIPAAAGLRERLTTMSAAIRDDIRRFMLPDGVSAGFVTVADGVVTPVIHPNDTTTGLTYRLIPMTQLMLAGVFDRAEAERHEAIIREHLHFPDGVRLTDKPTRFADGETAVFRRAEQAAFFGREVGLMYAHAHIRWAEALAALGRADVGEELLRLSPIRMDTRVPSAMRRQRTCYTSSSDAAFPDRYTAARDFDKLRTGEVPTADGWRVYSSGPGIYLRQVMHSLLGLEERTDVVVFAPTLSAEDDGLVATLSLAGRERTVRYTVDPTATAVEVLIDGAAVPATAVPHTYRWASASVAIDDLGDATVIDVRTPAGS